MRARMAPAPGEIGAAATVLAPFVALAAALLATAPPTAEQRLAADPVIRWIDAWGGTWLPVAIAGTICLAWRLAASPSGDELAQALRLALAGALAATLVALALRVVFGSHLPAAIPPEESAAPGLALGLAAGTLEEAVFRLVALPLLLGIGLRVFDERAAPLLAIAATGLLFALAHQLSPDADAVTRHFVVRMLIPGAAMSALFLRPGPAFVVSAHATAHLWIPALFR